MKKLWKRMNKKARYTIGSIVILALVIADSMCSKSIRENGKKSEEVQVEVAVSEEPEPSFATYEDLKQNYEEDTKDVNEDTANQPDSISTGEQEDTDLEEKSQDREKVTVIDESDETMSDETLGTEKEYDVNEEPQGKIKLTTPSQMEDEEVKIDMKPGGEQNVGTWD